MISIRRASKLDSEALFEWRNDEHTRLASGSTASLGWDEHQAWLARVLVDSDRFLYLAMDDSEAPSSRVAVCRFDLTTDGSAEVSINLNPAYRGKGLSRSVLEAAIATFENEVDDSPELTATIRPANSASIRIFTSAGFTFSGTDDGGEFNHYVR